MSKKGLIYFSVSKSWVSNFTNFFRRKVHGADSWPTHTAPIIELNGDLWTVDATMPNIVLNRIDRLSDPDLKVEIYEYDLDETKHEEAVEYLLDEIVGQPYGLLQYLGMGYVTLFQMFKIHVKNLCNWSYICSEVSYIHMNKTALNRQLVANMAKYKKDSIAPDDELYEMKKFPCKLAGYKDFGETDLIWTKRIDLLYSEGLDF